MKTIEKYRTFEELKSTEKAASDIKASLKKHASFESLMQKIYVAKANKDSMLKAATINGK